MFFKLFLLFTIVPVVELMLLLRVGSMIGFLNTVAIVLITGAIGAALARQQGMQTLAAIQQTMNAGKVPASALVDGFLILIAGVVLITPGILTDITGFMLLIPPCRAVIRSAAVEAFKKNVKIVSPFQQPDQQGQPQRPRPADDIIDVEATTIENDKKN